MTIIRLVITALAMILLLAGCKSRSAELADRCVTLIEEALIILEQHQETPDKAPHAFQAFMESRQVEVSELSDLASSIKSSGGKPEEMAIRRRFLQKIKPLQKRLNTMAETYRSKPSVLTELARIHQQIAPPPANN